MGFGSPRTPLGRRCFSFAVGGRRAPWASAGCRGRTLSVMEKRGWLPRADRPMQHALYMLDGRKRTDGAGFESCRQAAKKYSSGAVERPPASETSPRSVIRELALPDGGPRRRNKRTQGETRAGSGEHGGNTAGPATKGGTPASSSWSWSRWGCGPAGGRSLAAFVLRLRSAHLCRFVCLRFEIEGLTARGVLNHGSLSISQSG